MSTSEVPIRSVFDCNVFLQAMANPDGPAGACFAEVRTGSIKLFISRPILAELIEIASRPILVRKLALSVSGTEAFIEELTSYATLLEPVPSL